MFSWYNSLKLKHWSGQPNISFWVALVVLTNHNINRLEKGFDNGVTQICNERWYYQSYPWRENSKHYGEPWPFNYRNMSINRKNHMQHGQCNQQTLHSHNPCIHKHRNIQNALYNPQHTGPSNISTSRRYNNGQHQHRYNQKTVLWLLKRLYEAWLKTSDTEISHKDHS